MYQKATVAWSKGDWLPKRSHAVAASELTKKANVDAMFAPPGELRDGGGRLPTRLAGRKPSSATNDFQTTRWSRCDRRWLRPGGRLN